MSKSTIIYLLLLLHCSVLLNAQEVPEIIHFGKSDYQGANQNWMFAQDCDGLIFVANTDGVLIYNGFSWRLVRIKDNLRPRAVYLGKDCKIYTGGYETFGFIDMSIPANPTYVDISEPVIKNTKEEIWNIFGNKSEIIFQSFADVYAFDYDTIKPIKPPTNVMLGTNINEKLYLPKIAKGIFQIENNQYVEVEGSQLIPERAKITAVLEYKKGLLIATQYDGLFTLDANKHWAVLENNQNTAWKKEEINKMIKLSNGRYAIGTILNGLYIVDESLNLIHHISKQNGLSNNTVLSLFEDNEAKLWVGLDKGINVINQKSSVLFYYDKQGLLGTVYAVLDAKGNFYLGTNQGVFIRPQGGTFSFVSGTQGQVWSLLETAQGVLCGHNSGTFLIDGNGNAQMISDITGGWDMHKVNDSTILQATYTGLILFKLKNGKTWSFDKRVVNGDITIERFEISNDRIMTYHSHEGLGLLKMSQDFDTVKNKNFYENLAADKVNKDVLFFDLNKEFVVLNGQKHFQTLGDSIVPLNKSISDPRYAYYKEVLRLADNGGNLNAHRNLMNKNLILTSNDDGYQILPANDSRLLKNVEITLDYLLVNGEIHKTTNKFKANENDFSFYLKKRGEMLGSKGQWYQLSGWDDAWVDIPNDGILTFKNLPDGNYKLLIKLEDSEVKSLIEFTIAPHWYESWLGFVLLCIVLISGLWFFDQWHDRNLEREKEKLRKEKELEIGSQIMKAENEKLEHELNYKAKMLANSTMTLVQKNAMLNELKAVVSKEEITDSNKKKWQQKIMHLIDQNLSSDEEWEIFEQNFAEVHEEFLNKLSVLHPDLTNGELKLAAYIRMDLSSKEIAPLLNISLRSVENKRYRLRKKLGLEHDDNLSSYLLKL